MIVINGSQGEGGGQILRTALALSMVTGKPFHMINVRAGRPKPGLLRQHLTALKAATEICSAIVTGDELGSTELTFAPSSIRPGHYEYKIGTAGSTTLVLQTVLPPLLLASGPSTLVLEGGTHNPFAPPYDFLAKCFLPLINRMGAHVTTQLERPGFYPAGGGRFTVNIQPTAKLQPLELLETGLPGPRIAKAMVANLPRSIAERELSILGQKLLIPADQLHLEAVPNSPGPGNIVTVELPYENLTELFTGFGERGVTAEAVAEHVVSHVRRYLAAQVPVGEHLADQLLIPLALAGAGAFKTLPLSSHSRTNREVIQQFLEVPMTIQDAENRNVIVKIG